MSYYVCITESNAKIEAKNFPAAHAALQLARVPNHLRDAVRNCSTVEDTLATVGFGVSRVNNDLIINRYDHPTSHEAAFLEAIAEFIEPVSGTRAYIHWTGELGEEWSYYFTDGEMREILCSHTHSDDFPYHIHSQYDYEWDY